MFSCNHSEKKTRFFPIFEEASFNIPKLPKDSEKDNYELYSNNGEFNKGLTFEPSK